ncbi:hypothetical protein B8W69_22485 [Mycobacterium vulneris]|uniref:Secreted protein n=1 Tax=Mycolicibacterium vulneris TaxID=547163 RepID=A0A1X2KRV2_9MYCO|nr:hypothetical protein [Mycolicibacterium vulneris]OSC23993.1 hypothetical protein B8W69_22485 [Mycolicibacterium vulneris]
MSRPWSLTSVTVIAVFAITSAAEGRADPPMPGDECTVLHSTTQDVNNRPMWCNPTTTGPHALVWQYGGPSSAD